MSSDSIAGTEGHAYNLKDAGDFIERVKGMGATAIVVGGISVRFPDVLAQPRRAKAMTEEERLAIQEHSA